MRTTLLASLAAATLLSSALLAEPAAAMSPASRATLDATPAGATLVQKAKTVCGNIGCVPVQTSRIQHRKPHR